jgi:hypothetical protein
MTKSIIVTYDEADEPILMTLLKKIKAKTEALEMKKVSKTSSIDRTQNRLEILAATVELDNKVFHKIAQEDLYELINN